MRAIKTLTIALALSAALLFMPHPAGAASAASAAGAASAVALNEALVNEPGGTVSLEWFELLNDSTADVSLDGVTLTVNGSAVALSPGVNIAPGGFLIVSRNIVAFESLWGDGSGFWGDDATLESYNVIEAQFALVNGAGRISLVIPSGDSSILTWPAAGNDGVSWERVRPADSIPLSSLAALGATPGNTNSRSPLGFDWGLALSSVTPQSSGETLMEFAVLNRGDSALQATCVVIIVNPQPGGVVGPGSDSLGCVAIPALVSGDSAIVSILLFLPGVYAELGALIRDTDESVSNNLVLFTAPGEFFPPVIINEFLPDPEPPQSAEWVELKNVSSQAIDVALWRIGDSLSTKLISSSAETLLPGGYLIVTEDRLALLADYPGLSARVVEALGWARLNNSGDKVRLIDSFGFVADSFSYSSGFGGNLSWSRSEEPGMTDLWGRSLNTGGAPGDSNRVLFAATGQNLSLSIAPNPFSPDGDATDDTAYFQIEGAGGAGGAAGAEMQVTVYDRDGRVVRELFRGAPFSGRLAWDGMTDSGRRAPIGIYIVYVETQGVGSAKNTVVVAR
ncbi:MAG: lamin tail domain-containing protein [Candidatus Zixiibacteriota bacterium]